MNCPNDRYVNDAAICQAVAANLARIGVKVNLMAETKISYFPKILRRDTSFYLLGWTPSTVDSHDTLSSIMATPNEKGQGQFNLGAYSNPKLDELTLKIQSETDQKKRNEMIREAFKIHQDDVGHIPLHQQALAWATSKKVELVQLPEQLHVLQVDHVEVQVGDAIARTGRRERRAGAARRRSGGGDARRRRRAAGRASSTATSGIRSAARRWRSARRWSPCSASSRRCSPTSIAPHNPFDLATLELERLDAAAVMDERRHAEVPARHRRARSRRALGADVRRPHLALRRRRVGAALAGHRRRPGTACRAMSAAASTR